MADRDEALPAPEGTALWRRICQLATDRPDMQPDMDPERFARILSTEKRPSTTDLALIADAFGVTVAWLLTGGDDEGPTMSECRLHDYRLRYWGHDFIIKPDPDPVTARVTGWGNGVQLYDLLLLPNGDGVCLYEIETIRRPGKPPDMWFANCRFVPTSSELGCRAVATLGKSATPSALGLTSWRVLDG